MAEWIKRTWEKGLDYAKAKSVVQSADGGYVVAGWSLRYGTCVWIAELASAPAYEATGERVFGSLVVAIGLEFASLLILIVVLVDSAISQRRRRRVVHAGEKRQTWVSAWLYDRPGE